MPLPNEDTTPPVTNTKRVKVVNLNCVCEGITVEREPGAGDGPLKGPGSTGRQVTKSGQVPEGEIVRERRQGYDGALTPRAASPRRAGGSLAAVDFLRPMLARADAPHLDRFGQPTQPLQCAALPGNGKKTSGPFARAPGTGRALACRAVPPSALLPSSSRRSDCSSPDTGPCIRAFIRLLAQRIGFRPGKAAGG